MPTTSSRPRFIINADDFGLSPGVNLGVIAAYRGGILTSATLLANAPAFDQAVGLAAENPGLAVGAHLNLVRGRPLSPAVGVAELVDASGAFRPFRWRRMTAGFLRQAGGEYRRQLDAILAAGITPSHIDFEKHHAWQAPLYSLAARLADEYGIRAVRVLREPVAYSVRRMGWPGWRQFGMACVLRVGVDLFGGRGRGADRLLGQTHIGGMDERAWLGLASQPPQGVSEIMTHPGRAEAESPPDMGESWLAGRRETELRALLSPRVAEALRGAGVELISYRDLPA